MINFPVFEHLNVKEYGLYPGTNDKPGIEINFKPGLTLILGANGIGKTTLITILYRMLAGPYDFSKSTLEATELGGASLDVKPLNSRDKALFSQRVQDLAENATATLKLSIAQNQLTIKRKLKNLELVSLQHNSEVINDETEYQVLLPKISGVSSFGDWLLLLRHMVFYFEDRRELVWDTSAQRHIFRMMFLSPQDAENWYRREREILRLDSRYRNDTAAYNRLRKRVAASDRASGDEVSLRTELATLTKLQEKDEVTYGNLVVEADDLDNLRHELRKNLLEAEWDVDKSAQALETEKLSLLKEYFPSNDHTAQHLYSVLISEDHCIVCGQEAHDVAKELSERVESHKCVVCGNDVSPDFPSENIVSFSKEKVHSLHEKLESEKGRVSALKVELGRISSKYDSAATRLINIRSEISERSKQINRIENALPDDEKKQVKDKSELSSMNEALVSDKAELSRLATLFKKLIEEANVQILKHTDEIKSAFGSYASGFLAENAQLKWSPISESVGQVGLAKVTFPAFDLEMSGSNFTLPTARKGPDAVSESQREFIDLAFRMALIKVAGNGVGGSLVIDAPESSLDAFFVKRAANVLSRFGLPESNNRLVIASNLVDGQLLPEMIRNNIPENDKHDRLINLMEIAVPTAALRENREEYNQELHKILNAGGLND